MSFKEVTVLRKSGNLEAAIELARADLREEQSEWTYSALFWVLNDYCKLYISQNHVAEAKECLDEMNNLLENMLDNEGIAERTVSSLRKRIIPNRELVYNMSELSKAGNVEEAEKLYRQHVVLYNADVLGYNFWISFFLTRYIYKILKRKTKDIIS